MAAGWSEGFFPYKSSQTPKAFAGLKPTHEDTGKPHGSPGICCCCGNAPGGSRVPGHCRVVAEWGGCPQVRWEISFLEPGEARGCQQEPELLLATDPCSGQLENQQRQGQGEGSGSPLAADCPSLAGFLGDSSLICGSCFCRALLLIQVPKFRKGYPSPSYFSA